MEFGTGALDGLTVSSVTFSLVASSTSGNTTAHTSQFYAYDWGGSIDNADWRRTDGANSWYTGKTLLASKSTSGISAGTRYDFTSESGFASAVSTTGPTRLVGSSNRVIAGTVPSGNEYVEWNSSDTAGTTSDPKLTVVATDVSAPTVVSIGTEAKGTNATVTPTLPADIADNDILLCFVAYRAGTPNLTQSYTKKATHTNGYANLDVWWKRASGSQTAPAVSGCTNSVIAQLISVRGAKTTDEPFEVYVDPATGTDATEEAPSVTTSTASALLFGAISTDDDNSHYITSTGNLSAVELLSFTQNSNGDDNSLCLWAGRRSSAGALGTFVVTQLDNSADAWTHVAGAIAPASSGFTGTAESTLKAPTCSASGEETFSGTSSDTVKAPTCAATGYMFNGTSNITMPAATESATGALTFSGASVASVQKATVTAGGSETFTGTANVTTTGKVYSEGSQLEPHVGNSESTLTSVPSAVSSGELVFSAYAASSATGLVLCSAEGTYEQPPFTASGNITVVHATCSATGSIEFSGTGTSTNAHATCAASGTYTPQAITGDAVSTLVGATCSATGAETFSGTSTTSSSSRVSCVSVGVYTPLAITGTTNSTTTGKCSITSSGALTFAATGTPTTTGKVSCSASGTYTPQAITGTCSSTMKRATCVAVGSNYLLKTTKRPTTHIGIIETDHTQNIPKMKVGVIECQ